MLSSIFYKYIFFSPLLIIFSPLYLLFSLPFSIKQIESALPTCLISDADSNRVIQICRETGREFCRLPACKAECRFSDFGSQPHPGGLQLFQIDVVCLFFQFRVVVIQEYIVEHLSAFGCTVLMCKYACHAIVPGESSGNL